MTKSMEVIENWKSVVRPESKRSQAKFAARHNFSLKLALPEENAFRFSHFATWVHQRLPGVRLSLACEKNFDLSGQVFTACSSRRWIGVYPNPAPQQAGWDHASIIEDEELVSSQQIRKFGEETIAEFTRGTMQLQQAGGVAAGRRMLGDQLAWKLIIEVVKTHLRECIISSEGRKQRLSH